MRYIQNYNDFTNEGLLNFLEKAFKGLMDAFNDTTKKIAGTIMQQLEKVKSMKESMIILKKSFDTRLKEFENQKNYRNIQEYIKNDMMLINLDLGALSKKFGKNELKPAKFYEKSQNKLFRETFKWEKSGQFTAALDKNIKIIMTDIAKKSGIKDIETKLGTEKTMESKLYEAQEIQGEDLSTDETFIKFKDAAGKWRNDALVKPFLFQLEKITKEEGGMGVELKKIADTMKGTVNKESGAKVIRKVVDSEKPQLIKVRDTLGLTKQDAPL